ncbi:MAG TPA: hypothetical protein VMH82_03825 [Myxococcota bacterium]|jgi:hypothetical protein|nr:hypothetical protein [Myxococcota bacterium]
MRNAFLFLLLITAIWVGIEVMNHGMSGAFGGAFARVGLAPAASAADPSLAQRAAGTLDSAYRRSASRADRPAEE